MDLFALPAAQPALLGRGERGQDGARAAVDHGYPAELLDVRHAVVKYDGKTGELPPPRGDLAFDML